jgi:cytochrome P450
MYTNCTLFHRMPYTEATLLEVQRVCNVIPLVHRVCTADTTLGSYTIEKVNLDSDLNVVLAK